MLALAMGIALVSCNQGSQRKTAAPALKTVDKNTMLHIIIGMTRTLQRKDYSRVGGKKFLSPYLASYKITLNGMPHTAVNDRGFVHVFVDDKDRADPNKYVVFDFYLPAVLGHQLTFADFNKALGKGTPSPPVKEPTSFSTIFFINDSSHVSVNVDSQKPDTAVNNTINLINVARYEAAY